MWGEEKFFPLKNGNGANFVFCYSKFHKKKKYTVTEVLKNLHTHCKRNIYAYHKHT